MEPWVPGWVEVMRGAESCQHCMTEFPNAAPVTVMLRCLAAEAASVNSSKGAKVATRRETREEKEHMAEYSVCDREELPAYEFK